MVHSRAFTRRASTRVFASLCVRGCVCPCVSAWGWGAGARAHVIVRMWHFELTGSRSALVRACHERGCVRRVLVPVPSCTCT
eukprot:6212758-Pleurochrysis_carterae.AAC.2